MTILIKGGVLVSSDKTINSDIVIWDPVKKARHGVNRSHQRTDYSLYEGWELCGLAEKVFLRGQLIVDGEKWLGKAGLGEFLLCLPRAAVL